MEISVRQINIKPKYIKTLLVSGIVLVSHLNVFNTKRLSYKTKLTEDECEEILASIKPKRPHYKMKANELMIRPFKKISTSLEELDLALGGGIRCGQLTEISGEAGVGKSNLIAQIGMLVMMPVENNGLNGNVLLVHTEGEGKLKLTIKRYSTIATATLGDDKIIRSNLHVMNCCNEFELIEMVNRLHETSDKIAHVKLIVIDSIASAFAQTEGDSNYRFHTTRTCRLTRLVKKLAQFAWDRQIAVLITNHVSFNVALGENKPKMGKFWSHMCQTKIYLERGGDGFSRKAYVTKGAINVPLIAQFRISDRMQS